VTVTGSSGALTYAWFRDGTPTGGAGPVFDGELTNGSVLAATVTATVGERAAYADDGEAAGPAVTATINLEGPVPGGYAFEEVLDITMPADIAPFPDGTLLIATRLGDLVHVDPAAPVSFVSVIGLDLRYSATETGLLAAHTEYWHANPNANDGIPLAIPGDPDGSALVGMLEDSDMPPVAVWAPVTAAIATIRAWNTGLAP